MCNFASSKLCEKMSNLIVGFDFSKGSAYAVDLSIDIANRLELDLRLVYVMEKDEDEAPVRAEIERRNAGVAHLLHGIKMDYVIRKGKVPEELCKQAEEDDSQLIVVGTHGMSGFSKNWIGRNTYRTISDAKCPVLTIREDFNFNKKLEQIIVPLDNTSETRQKLPIAVKFARAFDSTLVLVGLYTSDSADIRNIVRSYVHVAGTYLTKEGIRHKNVFLKVPSNLTVTTLEYAEKIQADMIIIMTEQESSLNSFFKGSYAEQMLTLSRIPICSIHPEELFHVSK